MLLSEEILIILMIVVVVPLILQKIQKMEAMLIQVVVAEEKTLQKIKPLKKKIKKRKNFMKMNLIATMI